MLALKIILITFCVLFLLSLVSIRIVPTYKDDILKIKVYYGFIGYTLFPQKEKKSKKLKKSKVEKKNTIANKIEPTSQPENSNLENENNIPLETVSSKSKSSSPNNNNDQEKNNNLKELKEKFDMVLELIKASKKALILIKNHFIVDKVFVDMKISGEDAYETALNYSNHVSIVTNFIGVLSQFCTVKLKNLKFEPDFLSQKSYYDLSLTARIRLFWLLIASFSILKSILKQTNFLNKKGGKKYEPKSN